MKAGEYIGKDGRTYRYIRLELSVGHCYAREAFDTGCRAWLANGVIDAEDVAKDRQTLDALIEAEAGEWVYISDDRSIPLRIRPDGTEPQYQNDGGYWGHHENSAWPAAYRKGREVALEEAVDKGIDKASELYGKGYQQGKAWVWEQVKELQEAVDKLDWSNDSAQFFEPVFVDKRAIRRVWKAALKATDGR